MWPTILSLGPVNISTQGVILAFTLFFGTFWIWKRGREEHFDEEALIDMVILSSLVGLIFSRVFYVILNLNLFGSFWQAFQLVKKPGFYWLGALFGGLLTLILFTRNKKWGFYLLADLLMPPLVLAQALARLGNFFSGTFYGKETDLPIGIIFPGLDSPRHPLQLYAFSLYLLLMWLLLKLEKEYRFYGWYQGKKREAEAGFVFFSYFVGAGMIQLALAFLREDWLYWNGISLSLLLPILEILVGIIGLYKRSGLVLPQEKFLSNSVAYSLRRLIQGVAKLKQPKGLRSKPLKLEFKGNRRIKVGRQV